MIDIYLHKRCPIRWVYSNDRTTARRIGGVRVTESATTARTGPNRYPPATPTPGVSPSLR